MTDSSSLFDDLCLVSRGRSACFRALIIAVLSFFPSLENVYPKCSMCCLSKMHLVRFNVTPFNGRCLRNWPNVSSCDLVVFANINISSAIFIATGMSDYMVCKTCRNWMHCRIQIWSRLYYLILFSVRNEVM